ncbi:MAG TPA: CDP-glycerol glycerophosphotransferase family protein [Candidatus Paceibacterota bacterium]
MKTIFITIFQGAEAKNILRTDIYQNLIANENTRLVFFVDSIERAEYYKKEFSHPRVIYEVANLKPSTGLNAFFSWLSFVLLRTATTDLRRKMALETSHGYIRYVTGLFFNRLLARRWIRKIVRRLDYFFVRSDSFSEYFEKYKPSVIFLAHLFDDREVNLLREAKRRGVRTIGFINSWDKLTARHSMRLLPDSLIVFNNIVKQEAIDHADMSEKDIFVSGIPQYDWHVNYKPVSREEFCEKRKLDSTKKIIVYAPMGKAFSNSDWDIIDLLNYSITRDSITNAQLLVRFQPNDFTDEAELKKRPWLIYDLPGVRFSRERGVNWDMSFDDIRGLTDTLANVDLFICYASSISVEAAIFDVPVINIDFEVKDKQLLSQTPTFFYKTEHYGRVVKSDAIRYPKSQEEYIDWINKYLENPGIDRSSRKRLVAEQCWKLDGKAGQRIADYIIMNK